MSDNNNNNSSSSNINKQELREDLLKSAVSFLSSPNVQSADKNKKTAFLEKKGLTQEEIDEAFKRVGDATTLDTTTTATTTTTTTTNLPTTAARIPIVPPRTHIPQVIYHPLPPTPSMPAEKVFALAVFFGIGTVGLTAAIVGVLKKFISPVFNRIADYQRDRYNQRKQVVDKLLDSLSKYHSENDDLDAVIDQGDQDTLMDALVQHQADLNEKIQRLAQKAKDQLLGRKAYLDLNLIGIKLALLPQDTKIDLSGLKSDIRTLKAVLLNRRNFPIG
ncbi:hypothetical protein G6F57_007051 [Rhizopus arrhizus]|uniref:Peroxisomal membrane protein PEX14 n=1 Tax=Rhizopus oryzae TaxID=64495 RepID=A0A9P6X3H6_RHIOR|nr:hypothetical protein G6F23_004898 [Rhizopus arrhizus]KAG1415625.1 hypothetical protein G6F58_006400 [Rhizopus delemar]KAG0759228.1 hypothetical protein G6F24_009222 [Rhizopus arrhizus]KAG0785355.1 hypothetical protein G6F21_009314 [Rhizopus arrhizus]KAG0790162.1 hypothetical protein G6F22_006490 [Rhizopus arrhizus]